jgi:phosphonate transport system permease protein
MKTKAKRAYQEKEEIKPSLVPPLLAAILSAIIPGLGQILARIPRRGIVLILGFFTNLVLLIWRFRLVARRDVGFVDIFNKGIHLEPILLLMVIVSIALWIWIIVDAYLSARRPQGRAVGLFLVLIIVFVAMGWQVGQINMVKLISEIGDADRLISDVFWPWERAIDRPETYIEPSAIVLVPCMDDGLDPTVTEDGGAEISISPTCGELAEQDGTQGTDLTLTGTGFIPNEEITIMWKDPLKVEFRARYAGDFLVFPADENGEFEVDFSMPYRLVPPSAGEGQQDWTIVARQVETVGAAGASEELNLAVEKMIETIFIGMMATAFGIILALPFSFLAARNLMSGSGLTLAIYYVVRTFLNIVRSIEPLIWAIIFVIIVGLGPFAGILALTIHSIAALGKLYSESIESIDPGPIEAVQATGANWIQTVMFAVVPQIIPPFVSFTIYRWDINIRMSTVVGLVGGGGIGYLLVQWIGKTDFQAAGIAVWFITVTVAILDYISAEIRERFI